MDIPETSSSTLWVRFVREMVFREDPDAEFSKKRLDLFTKREQKARLSRIQEIVSGHVGRGEDDDTGDCSDLVTGQTMRVQVSARSWQETKTSATWGLDAVMVWRIARRRGTWSHERWSRSGGWSDLLQRLGGPPWALSGARTGEAGGTREEAAPDACNPVSRQVVKLSRN